MIGWMWQYLDVEALGAINIERMFELRWHDRDIRILIRATISKLNRMHLADNRDEIEADMSMQSKSPNFIDLIVVNVLEQENSLSCLSITKKFLSSIVDVISAYLLV